MRRMERLADRHAIERAHIIVEAHHPERPTATTFNTHIHLHLPGHEVIVSNDKDPHHTHESVWVALRDAMDKAERQLDDLHRQNISRRRSGTEKR